MKSNKDFRPARDVQSSDSMRKATKLSPIHKSGKDRHAMYEELVDEDEELYIGKKRESVLDYYDD